MAYAPNCRNSTGCFVLFGGSTGGTLRSDTAIYYPPEISAGLRSSTQCAVVPERTTANIACPAGFIVGAIPFASYGESEALASGNGNIRPRSLAGPRHP